MKGAKRGSSKGFSLIELMIVVAIIGILGAIAIPSYLGIQTRAKRAEVVTNLETLRVLQEKRYAEMGQYVPGAGTAALKEAFREFQPGDPADLWYEYAVTTSNNDQDFVATATGKTHVVKAGSPDPGKVFGVNQDNVRTIDGEPAKW